ncbi:Uncharacterised protein [Sphingobacterium mizutaii]|uniref:Uncharacterized protein n=1 Tax=Sphingobacterium mizutaii TaxID=1010 RepID=A0AAJ4XDG3_9SPHI|nr:hypothetical protein SAMN05192578_1011282 [Sphingobacterium mizutaii]SNV51446.1 Uncharacterised protein [Sphingobacterium mizutaii]
MLLVGDYEGDSPLSNMLPNQSQFLLSELPNRIRVTARTLELILVYPPIHRILVHSPFLVYPPIPNILVHPSRNGIHITPENVPYLISHISYLLSII